MNKKRGRKATGLYLNVRIESEKELNQVAKEANRAADRMIRRLDETIAYVDRVLSQMRNHK